MKKYMFTESQIKAIVEKVIEESKILKEQEEEKNYNKVVQKFLNEKLKLTLTVDGFIGPKTTEAIERYQTMIGVYPVDGVWGPETERKMPSNDKLMFRKHKSASEDIIDKIVNLFTPNR